jgi:hypothetical protein
MIKSKRDRIAQILWDNWYVLPDFWGYWWGRALALAHIDISGYDRQLSWPMREPLQK